MTDNPEKQLKRYISLMLVIWTVLLLCSLLWNMGQEKSEILTLARQTAIDSFNKDVLYRRWVARHGGVYVPVTNDTPPNPYLANIAERDIRTPSGRLLTLLNPAYMTRQVFEMGAETGIYGHITSLKPIRHENAPDAWEQKALEKFEHGKTDLFEVVLMNGEPYLRYMHVLKTEQACLKCHAIQGYQLGDVRGGISNSVPLARYYKFKNENIRRLVAAHLFIWLFGLFAVALAARRLLKLLRSKAAAEKSLEQAGLEWSAAMDATDDAIYLLDLNRCVLRANRSFLRLTNKSAEDMIGRHITEIVHPKGELKLCHVCQAQEERRDAIFTMEADNPDNPAGVPIEITVKIIRNGHDEPVSMLMTIHDLTNARQVSRSREELEEQLQQAQKMEAIGTLAGGIAHDFNNILTAIIGFTDLAMHTVRGNNDKESESSLREVLAAGNRAKELVKQILTFSRHNSQEMKPLSVQLVVKEAMKLLRSSIPTTIEFKQDICRDCQPVLADPTQIHQVILNLCTNAYHAMREIGGVLSVSLEQIKLDGRTTPQNVDLAPGDYVKLTVSDTGSGISDEALARIFEPYFTTKGQEEGTGLGLAVVHGIVESCKGKIVVHSEIGRGTDFYIYLPVIESVAQNDNRVESGMPPTGHEHILLVDDDRKIVEMEDIIFTSLGYKVTALTSSVETLVVFKARPGDFDVLVTDMTMPGLTGADLARACLRVRPDMPIILCTGFSEIIDEEKAAEIGICEYLMKPASKMELARAVRSALRKGK